MSPKLADPADEQTLQRGEHTVRMVDANASDRLLRLAAVTEQAIGVFGSTPAAESWLVTPAIGLDGRTPLDLLQSLEGSEQVEAFLTRIDYGVYS
ncbi:MAG: antitoxin Xre/MbcA/ParS toxin-binding domain-containing protein [Janthinobacterium lividum]